MDIASSIFAPNSDEKISLIKKRYGGYWRYPNLIDFCYLVNPYFPPQKLIDELKASAEKLLTQYPSGMYVNSLLAAKNFGVHQENILVGNGAAELIKTLMNYFSGRTGFIRPTFEEYPNRYNEKESVNFIPQNENFSYTVEDIINFFNDKDIKNLIVVNPDNPSGNYILKFDLFHLLNWTKDKNINLLIDESFVDFADENDTLIVQNTLDENKNLYVMKSISKSYGVPGLRLGILASGDTKFIAEMKYDVPIWNINSFAEFYLQIAEKYKKDYIESLKFIRIERERFQNELNKICDLRVIPSKANFIMIELSEKINVKELTKILLVEHNILVKDLTEKIFGKNYLRVSIKSTDENEKLLKALENILM